MGPYKERRPLQSQRPSIVYLRETLGRDLDII
jgi:hypothetical protein